MKSLFTTLLLLITISVSAQEISSEIKYALKNDDAKALKKELNKENINICFEVGNSEYSLLNLSIKLDAKACFELLLTKKVDVDKECSGKTPLMYSAKYGRLEMAKMLIKNNADINKKYKGRSALDYAKKYEKTALIEYFKSL